MNGLRKYNYFDDDQDDIQSLISSFDAPKEEKKEAIDKSLKEIANSRTEHARRERKKSREEKEFDDFLQGKKSDESPSRDKKPEKKTEVKSEKKPEKGEIIDAVKAFSKKSGEKIVSVAHAVKEGGIAEEFEKLSKKKKTRVTVIMVFVFFLFFALMVAGTLRAVDSENKRIAKFNEDAGKVCSQCITKYGNSGYENLYSAYGITGYRMTGLSYAREMDFNNDNVSELLVCYDEGGVYFTEVWGYNNHDEFICFYRDESTQTKKKSDDAWITIYVKNNKYYLGVHSGDKLEKVDLYQLKGTSFEKKYTADYDAAAQAFSFDGKVDANSFERIKLAVLVEEKAVVNADKVSKTVETFIGPSGIANLITSSQNINNAYYEVVEDYNQTYGKAKVVKKNGLCYVDGLAVVDLTDFDGDGKDELVLIYRKPVKVRDSDAQGSYISKVEDKYYIEIYRYNSGKAILAYKNESISNSLGESEDMYYIIKKKNGKSYYCVNAFSVQESGRVISATSSTFKFDGIQFSQQYEAAYRTNYGYTHYYIDDTEVYSKSEFDNKGYSVPLFNGEEKYDSKTYTVTFLQRKLLKAERMDDRVDETIRNIRTLNTSYSGDTE